MRRIGIVAVARRLLIDLWRYIEYDKIPEGARLKSLPLGKYTIKTKRRS